jgi:hypothetical protein
MKELEFWWRSVLSNSTYIKDRIKYLHLQTERPIKQGQGVIAFNNSVYRHRDVSRLQTWDGLG